MKYDVRPHIVMAVITLILALALLTLIFIPRQPKMQRIPATSFNSAVSQVASVETLPTASLLVTPPFTLQAV